MSPFIGVCKLTATALRITQEKPAELSRPDGINVKSRMIQIYLGPVKPHLIGLIDVHIPAIEPKNP